MQRRALLVGPAAWLASAPARAAGYPERPVRIIVPFAPGGPTDLVARIVAAQLGERLHGSFIVDNHAGAGGNIGAGLVARAAPDGHTLLVTSSALVVNPSLYKRLPYDPVVDFAPVSELGTAPNMFVANPAAGITTIAQLVARAKADPTALSFSSAGIGTTPHLSGELLKLAAGIELTHVPFGGAGPATQAVLAGTTPLACTSIPPVLGLVKTGALVALAVTSESRWPALPDVPTMVELGYPGFLAETFQALLAPAATPSPVLDVLVAALTAVLNDRAVHDQLVAAGFETSGNGPAALRERIVAEGQKWRSVIAKAGIAPV